MGVDPGYEEYGLLKWIAKERSLRYTGYTLLGKRPVVRLLVLRWLLWWRRYRDYTEVRKAHEFMHALRNDGWHDPVPGDLMSERCWGSSTDKQGAMEKSYGWRSRIRGLRSYPGSPTRDESGRFI